MSDQTYWFRCEPIKWRVLDKSGDSVLLMSEYVLDTHAFNDSIRADNTWENSDARTDNTADGTLVTLTFEVQPTATVGETVVTVTYDADSTFNAALQFAQMYTSDGTVSVVDCTPGDASRDGKISLLDSVMLTRYLADGWDVTISEVNADVNGDAVLDLKDVVLIRRYLAGGWDAVLI